MSTLDYNSRLRTPYACEAGSVRLPAVLPASSLALLSLTLLAPPGAAAATKDCGNYGTVVGQAPDADGTVEARFTMREIDGAGLSDITAQVSSCKIARRLVRIASLRRENNPCLVYRNGSVIAEKSSCRVIGFVCRKRSTGTERQVTRCTRAGGRVVRWEAGA